MLFILFYSNLYANKGCRLLCSLCFRNTPLLLVKVVSPLTHTQCCLRNNWDRNMLPRFVTSLVILASQTHHCILIWDIFIKYIALSLRLLGNQSNEYLYLLFHIKAHMDGLLSIVWKNLTGLTHLNPTEHLWKTRHHSLCPRLTALKLLFLNEANSCCMFQHPVQTLPR